MYIKMKKVWLLLLLLFVIFWFWVSFANPIAPKQYCYTLNNVKIDNYRVIIEYGNREDLNSNSDNSEWGWAKPNLKYDNREREVYEPKQNKCTKCSGWYLAKESKVYLLDKNIDITDITQKNIDEKAIFVWNIFDSDCWSYYDETMIYKIVKYWDKYEITETKNLVLNREITGKLGKFFRARLFTILIETLVLLFIVKIFLKEYNIPNWKTILFWILPTTITLPLLWFALSLLDNPLLLEIISYFIWELVVAFVEAIIIKYWLKIPWGKAITASFICNLISLIVWWFIL